MNDLTTEEVSKLQIMQKIPQSFMNELERAVRENDGLKAENTMLRKKNGNYHLLTNTYASAISVCKWTRPFVDGVHLYLGTNKIFKKKGVSKTRASIST